MPLQRNPIRVLIVDDSAIVRKGLILALADYPDIKVVGTAPNSFIARDKILLLQPDVITLDLDMPGMDGLSFLKRLMKHHPVPVVIVSSLASNNGQNAMDALKAGAVEVVCKPGTGYDVQAAGHDLAKAIYAAAHAHIRRIGPLEGDSPKISSKDNISNSRIIAIGASTGGVQTLEQILQDLPRDIPGILVVQHMPAKFTQSFAQRLNQTCTVHVREACHGDRIRPGQVLIAPGGKHMELKQSGRRYSVILQDGPPVFHQKPSVDILFESVARVTSSNVMGVILTGMGCDGAQGLLKMRKSGAWTVAQDEQSSIVFGMPKEAILCGAAAKVLSLGNMAEAIIEWAQNETKQYVRKNSVCLKLKRS